MAPLTRNRAVAGLVPSPLAVEYYGQRATAGLLVTEASQVSQQGQGYQDTPGIYSKEQVAGWRKVTDRVHERGGRIFLQAWHVGRISHTSLQPNGGAPVAPSAIRAKGKTFVNNTFADISEPRALALEEIPGIIESFKRGAAQCDRGRLRRRRDPRRQRLSARPVRQGRHQQAHRRLWRIDREPRQADAGSLQGGRGRDRRRAYRHPHLAGDAGQRYLRFSNPQPLFDYIVDHLNALKLVYIHVIEGATGGPRDIAPFDYGSLAQALQAGLHRQ